MKKKTKIILGITIPLLVIGAVAGTTAGISTYLKDAKTPLGWCIEEIKEKEGFEKNNITEYAFSYTEQTHKGLKNEYDKYYSVDFYLETSKMLFREEWYCAISYKNTIWKYLKEDQIIKIKCSRISAEVIK